MTFTVQGLVLSKEFKPAVESFTDRQGKQVKAQPDRYLLYIAFGDKVGDIFNNQVFVKSVKVDQKTFDSLIKPFYVTISIDMANSLDDYRTKIVSCKEFTIYE